jgi:hypothetical protein
VNRDRLDEDEGQHMQQLNEHTILHHLTPSYTIYSVPSHHRGMKGRMIEKGSQDTPQWGWMNRSYSTHL